MSFGREKAWFGAALAAFGVGCAEDPSTDAKSEETKEVKVEKAPEEIIGQDEVMDADDELFVPVKDVVVRIGGGNGNVKRRDGVVRNEERGTRDSGEVVELALPTFRNILMEEAKKYTGKVNGFDFDAEVPRLLEFKRAQVWHNKFGESEEQLNRYFADRGDEKKRGIQTLLLRQEIPGVLDKRGNKTYQSVVNERYRDEVRRSVQKYCKQYNVPVSVALGVIGVESGGKHDSDINPNDGARGILQVKDVVVADFQESDTTGEWKGIDIKKVDDNIRVGLALLSKFFERYGDWGIALMAYNNGRAAFERKLMMALDRKLSDYVKLKKTIKQLKVEKKNAEAELLQQKVQEMEDDAEAKRVKVSNRNGGWPKFISDKKINFVYACSRNGLKMCELANGDYPFYALFLAQVVGEVMETEEYAPDLTVLMKK